MVVATATTAVVTAVTTTAGSGSGICISIIGISNLGITGSILSVSSALTPAGRWRLLGGTTIGGKDGILADGGLNSSEVIWGGLGTINLG